MDMHKKLKTYLSLIIALVMIPFKTLACDPNLIPTCHDDIYLYQTEMYNEGWWSTNDQNQVIYMYNEMYDNEWRLVIPDCGNNNSYIDYSYQCEAIWGCTHQYTRNAYKDDNSAYLWYQYTPVPNQYGGYDYHTIWCATYTGTDYFDWCSAH